MLIGFEDYSGKLIHTEMIFDQKLCHALFAPLLVGRNITVMLPLTNPVIPNFRYKRHPWRLVEKWPGNMLF